jgi:threonine dehydratase
MARALEAGHLVDIPVLPTLADGLAGAIDAHGLDVGRRALDGLMMVEEADIAAAIAFLARDENVTAEGSGAVGVAALLTGAVRPGEPVVVVISGGNIDREVLMRLVV